MRKFLKKAENVAKKVDREVSKNVLGLGEGHRISHLVNSDSIKHKDALNDFKGKNSNDVSITEPKSKSNQSSESNQNAEPSVQKAEITESTDKPVKYSFIENVVTNEESVNQSVQQTVQDNSTTTSKSRIVEIAEFASKILGERCLTDDTKDQLPFFNKDEAKLIASDIVYEAREQGIEDVGNKIVSELHVFAPELF